MRTNFIVLRNKTIIIFTKNPELGKVKTRIAATLGDQAALDIYIKLLDITRAVVSELNSVSKLLFYSDQISESDAWPSKDYLKFVQSKGDLGNRMESAFQIALKQSDKALIIGSDCPYITKEIIDSAFDQLDMQDVVIGPTFDGGYYMLGMNEVHGHLFKNVPWSTDAVFEITMKKVESANLSYWVGPRLSDIDHAEDWEDYLAK